MAENFWPQILIVFAIGIGGNLLKTLKKSSKEKKSSSSDDDED